MAFVIPKIPKIPTLDQTPFIVKTNHALQKVALKAQKIAAYIQIPVIGTPIKSISKAYSIANVSLNTTLPNLSVTEITTKLQTALSNLQRAQSNVANATSIESIDEESVSSEEDIDALVAEVEALQTELQTAITNLSSNLESLGEQKLKELEELANTLKTDLKSMYSKRATIKIPRMPKLPFGIIQPF